MLHAPAGVEWELLVVNNNCTDETDQVIQRHVEHLPIRRLFEPAPGLSHARNCAVASASGELLIWTDDDVLVDPQWLAEYAAAARQWPDAPFFGGPVAPWFEGEPPAWLMSVWSCVSGAYAMRDLAAEPILLDSSHLPYGANFAVRSEAQRKHRYDPALGVAPGRRMGFEETVLLRQVLQDGREGRWVPAAKVRHFIPRGRQTIGYLRSYFRGLGEYLSYTDDGQVPRLFGRPRWAWREAVQSEILYRVKRLFYKPESWIEHLIRADRCWGILSTAPKAQRRHTD